MKNFCLVVALALGLISCSKDKGTPCTPNATIVSEMTTVEKSSALDSKNQMIIPANSKISKKQKTVFSLDKDPARRIIDENNNVDNNDDDSDVTLIDFENNIVKSEGHSLGFSLDPQKSKSRGRDIYVLNANDLRATIESESKNLINDNNDNNDVKLCSVQDAAWSFSPDFNRNTVESQMNMSLRLQLTQQVVDQIFNIEVDNKK